MIHSTQVSPEIAARHAGYPFKFRRENQAFVASHVDRMPDEFRRAVSAKWLKDEKAEGLASANRNLLAVTGRISPSGLAMAADDNAVVDRAKDYAKKCELARLFIIREPIKHQYSEIAKMADRAGIEPPEIKAGVTCQGAVNRMCCGKWWRRQLRDTHKRWIESACIQFGSVRRGRALYVSDDCLTARKSQRRRNESTLKAMIAECVESGEQIPLHEAVAASVSNPKNRRNEMMLRMHGMQEWAREQGHSCSFLTITCPSRMHAASTKGRSVFDNKKYDGTTPRAAQAYLSNLWAKVRAELNRQGITVYGVRVAEPHHDGTPHWHVMLFAAPDELETAVSEYERYALADSPGEWGRNSSVRFKAKAINWKTDSAGNVVESPVSYVAKYIAKNLETSDLDSLQNERSHEDESTRLNDAIARVDAWRSCWGIRQFQFFGTHAVTVWRELRRIKEAPENIELLPLWETVHKTDDIGADWQAFMVEMDKLPSLIIATEQAETANAYGEFTKENIIGLVFTDTGLFEPTRSKRWVIKQSGTADLPWSPSNNCTGGHEKKSGGFDDPPDKQQKNKRKR